MRQLDRSLTTDARFKVPSAIILVAHARTASGRSRITLELPNRDASISPALIASQIVRVDRPTSWAADRSR